MKYVRANCIIIQIVSKKFTQIMKNAPTISLRLRETLLLKENVIKETGKDVDDHILEQCILQTRKTRG